MYEKKLVEAVDVLNQIGTVARAALDHCDKNSGESWGWAYAVAALAEVREAFQAELARVRETHEG